MIPDDRIEAAGGGPVGDPAEALPIHDVMPAGLPGTDPSAPDPVERDAVLAGTVADLPPADPLLDCLAFLAQHHGKPRSRAALVAGLPYDGSGLRPRQFVKAAAGLGLAAGIAERDLARLTPLVLPVVALLRDGSACVVVSIGPPRGRARKRRAVVMLPELAGEGSRLSPLLAPLSSVDLDDLAASHAGPVILVKPVHEPEPEPTAATASPGRAWFWRTLARSLPAYSQVLLASVLINLFALATPLFIMNIYDRVLPNRAVETGWVLAVGAASVFAFDYLLRSLRAYFIDVAGRRADVVLQSQLFDRMLDSRLADRPASVGAAAGLLREFEALRDAFTSATVAALVDLPFIFLFLFVVWLIAPPIAWLLVILVGAVIVVGLATQFPLRRLALGTLKTAEAGQGLVVEALAGLETIKVTGAESQMRARFAGLTGRSAQFGLRTRLLAQVSTGFAMFAQQMSTVVVVVAGMYLVAEGAMSPGGMIACVALGTRAIAPIAQVAQLITRYHQAMTALAALDRVMTQEVERPADRQFISRPRLTGAIGFDHVAFSYPREKRASLEEVSLSIAAGERVGVIGRVGSGKTTLVKMIAGLYQPDSGIVMANGTDLRQIDPVDLRRNVGMVPQDVFLMRGSLRDNIALGAPWASDADILKAAVDAGVDEFARRHPAGYDMTIGERGEGLSGGQRQAVALARALVGDPPILVLDEPTNALDVEAEARFRERLKRRLGGGTFVLVTHRSSLLSLVDRLIVLDQGRVVADGPRDQVLEALRQGRVKARSGGQVRDEGA